ncbi:MAG: 3-carboxy-cis,cis-muconate cycloisomerase [Bosea sp. (in: a-proteobacteria)]
MADDMGLYGELFADAAMRAVFSDRATLQGMLDFEAALARAQGDLGIIPASAANAIAQACHPDRYDIATIGLQATLAGNPAIPLVKLLTAEVAKTDTEAAKWVHWGATSQDVIDSGRMVQIREAVQLLEAGLQRLGLALVKLARQHRKTPCIGRTFLQHAVPVSFGLKAAGWLAPLIEVSGQLMAHGAPRLQFGGAAGTLAALGTDGPSISERLNAALFSAAGPALPWHAQRGQIARMGSECAILTGHLGKMARDISLMCQSEVGELAEPSAPGKGGSSTMPHKRNPVLCTAILAASQRAPGLASTLLATLPHEHERGLGGWHAEWLTLPELFRIAGAALTHSITLVEGLQVFPKRVAANIELMNGLTMAESVTFALAAHIGKDKAHHALEAAGKVTTETGQHLREVLVSDAAITAMLPASDIAALFEPASYFGASDVFINQILTDHATWHGGELHLE